MNQIFCCKKQRPTKIYWLYSREPVFLFELLFEAQCPKCNQLVLELAGITDDNFMSTPYRLKQKHHPTWLGRKFTDLHHIQEAKRQQIPKCTRALIYVGEYTMRISRGVLFKPKGTVACV
jgi:hypothetical protein